MRAGAGDVALEPPQQRRVRAAPALQVGGADVVDPSERALGDELVGEGDGRHAPVVEPDEGRARAPRRPPPPSPRRRRACRRAASRRRRACRPRGRRSPARRGRCSAWRRRRGRRRRTVTASRQSVVVSAQPQRAANSASSAALRAHTRCIAGSGSTSKKWPTVAQALEWARPMNFEPIRATLICRHVIALLSSIVSTPR